MEREILFAFDEQGRPTDGIVLLPDETDAIECDEHEEEIDII